jgi:hypothetical protein
MEYEALFVGIKENDSLGAAHLHNQNGFESNPRTHQERERSKKSCSHEVSRKSKGNGKTFQRLFSPAYPKG